MPENTRNVAPLNWQVLVTEALRRRKEENLTQREHAALASVSVPTIAAFDRGEYTLTLTKACDILRVVGLLEEPAEEGAHEAFVRDAFARWRELTSKLPADSPGRFPNGWCRFDYCLNGDLKTVSPTAFEEILRSAVTRHTGWPPFWIPLRHGMKPQEVEDTIECWLSPEETGRAFTEPAHCDFWRVSPNGRAFLIRGYQEDGQETFAPGTIFDTTLPIWRMSEVLLHAASLASLLRKNQETLITVRFRALFSGLNGRVLRAWANPLSDTLFEGHAARSDEAVLEAVVPTDEIRGDLARHVYPLAASLFERFGVSGLSQHRIEAEVARLLSVRLN